jgi:glutamyl-tRNA reductase
MKLFTIYLYNLTKNNKTNGPIPVTPKDVFTWETCQRTLILSPQKLSLPSSFIYYKQSDAIAYLLETVLGLHSKVYGETEILSQFKQTFLHTPKIETPWQRDIHSLCSFVAKEAKKIRTRYMKNSGHITYGSLVNDYIMPCSEIDLFGGGQLAEQLIPWLSAHCQKINCYVRNIEKAKKTLKNVTQRSSVNISYYPIKKYTKKSNPLIIAAPVENNIFQIDQVKPQQIIDLREVGTSPLNVTCPIITLDQLLIEQQRNIQQRNQNINLIKTEVLNSVSKWSSKPLHRPLGWEDACLYA